MILDFLNIGNLSLVGTAVTDSFTLKKSLVKVIIWQIFKMSVLQMLKNKYFHVQYVVSENIHTTTTEGIGFSGGEVAHHREIFLEGSHDA